VLREDNTEVELMETIDYGDTDYRYEMEGDRKYDDDYDNNSLSRLGYQTQEFDDESGELVTAEDDFADDFEADFDDSYEDEEF
jgi:DNA-directed RNA polymerase subunit beta